MIEPKIQNLYFKTCNTEFKIYILNCTTQNIT